MSNVVLLCHCKFNRFLPQGEHGPPQSTPSSFWFRIPSMQLSTQDEQTNVILVCRCKGNLYLPQGEQGPPQSTPSSN